MNKLAEIAEVKRAHVADQRRRCSLGDLERQAAAQTPPRGFAAALRERTAHGFALIAEIKKASPSKGTIRPDFDPPELARAYRDGGAACLSILTDEPYFHGSNDFLLAARSAVALPCLRKDFMIDPWQIAEARAIGADAVLLIMAILDDRQAADLEAAAVALGMDVLVEVHDERELDRACRLDSELIGINNRDLKSFNTDLGCTETLASRVPPGRLIVSESGIGSHDDLVRLKDAGASAFLVGEALMRASDVAGATRRLLKGAAQ